MAAHSPLVAGCSPGNEPFKFLESDVPLGLSKVAADYTLYAAHGGNVIPPGVQLALERANFGSASDAIQQNLDVVVIHQLKWTSLPKDRAVPVAVLPRLPACLVVGGVEGERVR
jgi:hypothetical protein